MLQIKNIRKVYKTGELVQKALDDVSLNLRDSEFVAILGPSGSGKTTLLNIIGGLDRYDSGDLIINGISTKEYDDRDWDTYRNHSIGFVFQSYNLVQHQNVLSNVELALTIAGISAGERKERAIKALEQVGLGDQIGKKPNQLSGGQMQRVALARALVNNPDILLADEPTGALDTETSLQVMNLMKEVAKDRLVVMVTHNPELAEQYASRIVRLRDGKITDDSRPFTDEEIKAAYPDAAADETVLSAADAGTGAAIAGAAFAGDDVFAGSSLKEEKKAKKRGTSPKKTKRSSMSFLTSLSLSFSNLRTKKGRTILTSLAGSIGIIGIALILSLSTGVNRYIDKIQRDTMASYPITISATSFDFASVMQAGMEDRLAEATKEEKEPEPDTLYTSFGDIEASTAVTTGIKENNLTEFKKYLDEPKSEIHQYIGENGIIYTYNVDFKVYSYDQNRKLVDSDTDVTAVFSDEDDVLGNMSDARSLMLSNMSTMFGTGGNGNAANFSEMMAGANGEVVSALIKDNYEVVYGNWPDSYDEIVLVIDRNGKLSSGRLYQLGLISRSQYENAVRKIEDEEEPEELPIKYKDICAHEFYLVTASDQYEKTNSGTYNPIGDDKDKLEESLKNAVKLRVVGIVQETEDSSVNSLATAVGYTTLLTDYLIDRSNNSSIIKDQEKNPELNVLTGQPFEEEEPTDQEKADAGRKYINDLSHKDKEAIYSSLMMIDYEGAMKALMTVNMEGISSQLASALEQAIGSAIQSAIQPALEQLMYQLQTQMSEAVRQVTEQAMATAMTQMMEQVMQKVMPQVMSQMMTQVQEKVLPELMQIVFQQAITANLEKAVRETVDQITTLYPEFLPDEMKALKEAKDLAEMQEILQKIDPTTVDISGIDFSQIDFSAFDFSNFDFSTIDYSQLDLSSLDFGSVDFSNIDLSGIDPGQLDFSNLDLSSLNLGSLDLSGLDFSNVDFSGIGESMNGISFSTDGGDMAEVVQYWLDEIADQKSLIKAYDQFIGVSSYDGNMKKFGQINYDAPSAISLYADSFEGKDGIAESLKHYNDSAAEENKITYTDYVALLTSSITTIINAISYVLIGFVAVSLFVSCIMIGIITNISVLERTKEIGVLRALGASKRNVANVFNAETFIIGCFSGIIGVGISLLLTIPINAIVHALMDSKVLSAQLPPLSAVILVIISIVITMIGGLIPASKAAKQDPVIALRTE